MRLLLFAALLLAGCGEKTSNLTAQLSWRFNYRDWTKPVCPGTAGCVNDDPRACDNERPGATAEAYDPVANVEINLDNPETPPYLESFPCGRGVASIKGLVRQVYKLRVSGMNAAGTVLYEYLDPVFDLSSFRSEAFELRAVVGELRHLPHFPDTNVMCPAGIETFHYKVTSVEDDSVATEGDVPACDGLDNVLPVYMRNIAVTPEQTETGGYTTQSFDVQIEARDAGGIGRYCSTVSARPVFPGNNSLSELSHNLLAGACPL